MAEKLEAIVSLGMANSRMKDYFDLRALAGEGQVDVALLADAIAATFSRRNTQIPADLAVGLSDEFAQDPAKRAQWRGFLNKSRLTAPPLDQVVAEVRESVRKPLRRAAERMKSRPAP